MKKLSFILVLPLFWCFLPGCKQSPKAEYENPKKNSFQFDQAAEKAIIDREISSWEFAKNKDFAKLKEIWGTDYTAFFGDHSLNVEEAVNSFQGATIKSYRLYNIKVKPVADGSAIIYYNLQQDVVGQDGTKWIPQIAASSVYIKRDNVWKNVFYHETALEEE